MTAPRVESWFLAICCDCKPILPQPFTDPEERLRWVEAHETTGHRIILTEERR